MLELQYVWDYAKELASDEHFSAFVRHMETSSEENKIAVLKKTVWYVTATQHGTLLYLNILTFRLMLGEIFDYCDGLAGQQVCVKIVLNFVVSAWPS